MLQRIMQAANFRSVLSYQVSLANIQRQLDEFILLTFIRLKNNMLNTCPGSEL